VQNIESGQISDKKNVFSEPVWLF